MFVLWLNFKIIVFHNDFVWFVGGNRAFSGSLKLTTSPHTAIMASMSTDEYQRAWRLGAMPFSFFRQPESVTKPILRVTKPARTCYETPKSVTKRARTCYETPKFCYETPPNLLRNPVTKPQIAPPYRKKCYETPVTKQFRNTPNGQGRGQIHHAQNPNRHSGGLFAF